MLSSRSKGDLAEDRATRYLTGAGYRILERNWRNRRGEIDIIAFDGPCLCIIEVKSRNQLEFGTPSESVTPAKQKKLIRLAEAYLTRVNSPEVDVRFDVVEVFRDNITLIRDAFHDED